MGASASTARRIRSEPPGRWRRPAHAGCAASTVKPGPVRVVALAGASAQYSEVPGTSRGCAARRERRRQRHAVQRIESVRSVRLGPRAPRPSRPARVGGRAVEQHEHARQQRLLRPRERGSGGADLDAVAVGEAAAVGDAHEQAERPARGPIRRPQIARPNSPGQLGGGQDQARMHDLLRCRVGIGDHHRGPDLRDPEQQLRERQRQVHAAVAAGIARHAARVQRHAVPGQPLGERHRGLVVGAGMMHPRLLQDGEHARRRQVTRAAPS